MTTAGCQLRNNASSHVRPSSARGVRQFVALPMLSSPATPSTAVSADGPLQQNPTARTSHSPIFLLPVGPAGRRRQWGTPYRPPSHKIDGRASLAHTSPAAPAKKDTAVVGLGGASGDFFFTALQGRGECDLHAEGPRGEGQAEAAQRRRHD
jgi:hypothetical protein